MSADDILQETQLSFLVITANVGTLFENLGGIENGWLIETSKVVKQHQPHFIALHCQEVGGKGYKSSMGLVKDFFRKFIESEFLQDYAVVQCYLDCDFVYEDDYTALGNVYFLHDTVKDAYIYDYTSQIFSPCSGKEIFTNDIFAVPYLRKEKFAQDFFPGFKWTRKGYIRVRWKIYGKVLEFVNVHLFHNESNLVSIKSSPSPYTAYRKRALRYVMHKLKYEHPIDQGSYIVSGDFNFRLDAKSLIQDLFPTSNEQVEKALAAKQSVLRVLNHDQTVDGLRADSKVEDEDNYLVRLEKKFFEINHSRFQPASSFHTLRQYDFELAATKEELKEFEVKFAPTYPYSEDVAISNEYMATRCPSWCDRVLLSKSLWDSLQSQKSAAEIVYDTIGDSVCMGDHKPVYLAFKVTSMVPNTEN